MPKLEELARELEEAEEDGIYRFYHGSNKVFFLQDPVKAAFTLIKEIGGEDDPFQNATRRDALVRYVKLEPVIDGVEGTFTKAPPGGAASPEGAVKFLGNVPATGASAQLST